MISFLGKFWDNNQGECWESGNRGIGEWEKHGSGKSGEFMEVGKWGNGEMGKWGNGEMGNHGKRKRGHKSPLVKNFKNP